MKKVDENKKNKLKLKSASRPNVFFEIRSLDEIREVGNYTWIAEEITDGMGFPDCVKDGDDCHCCEGQLFVMRHGAEKTSQSTDSFGQVLTIINHETGATNIFTRAVHPLDSDEWKPWQMVATGDPKLIAENNSINETLSTLRRQVENDSRRIETAENSLLASATVRFDRIEENEATINAGEIDSTPSAIVYYKPANMFVAADSAGNYWDTWKGMDDYMSGGKIREDKVYLCNGKAFIWDYNAAIIVPSCDGEYINENKYIMTFVDNNGRFLFGVTSKGEVDWKKGIPSHIQEKICAKVDRIEGHSLIQSEVAESLSYKDTQYIQVEIDAEGRMLSYTLSDGTKVHNCKEIFNSDVILNAVSLSPNAVLDICKKIVEVNKLFLKHPYAQYLPKIAKLKKGYDNYYEGKETTPPLVLAQFSDVHGDASAVNSISEFVDMYNIYIDDVYLTGDIVHQQFSDDLAFLNEDENKFLLVIGNHDAWKKNQAPVEVVTEKEVYDKFFNPYILGWNVVQPSDASSGKCYYIKDYAESKIRVITINCMHDTQVQLDFVSDALSDAREKELSVVIMCHYTADFTNGNSDVTFNTIDYRLLGGDYGTFTPKVADLLDAHLDANGKFIAWIGGHYHVDMFGYMLNHPRLLQINIEAASGTDNSGTDTLRIGADTYAFNIISLDTAMGYIKILRIGDNTDRHLRSKNILVYDYLNKKIINNY